MTEEVGKNEIFVAEVSKAAVVDTACTETVTGEKWLQDYMSSLDETLKKQVQVNSSTTGFKFGDGRKVYSTKKLKYLLWLLGKYVKLKLMSLQRIFLCH